MLTTLFIQVLNMSYAASFVILFVMLARLLLKKAPKIFSYALWGVVGFRLICPFSIPVAAASLPSTTNLVPADILQSATPHISTGFAQVDAFVNAALPTVQAGASASPLQIAMQIAQMVWLAGTALLLLYSIASLIGLRMRLKHAVHQQGNIWRQDAFPTPFVLGVIRPKIYLPATLMASDAPHILLHEQTHIRRHDPLWKLLAFLILCIHWFNPLVWAAFLLFSKDMEMSCDEAVIKQLGNEAKKSYSFSLLNMAAGGHIISSTPLAFGEANPKSRIRNVLNYKTPRFWVVCTICIAVIALAVALLISPAVQAPYTYRFPHDVYENFAAEKDYSNIHLADASGNDITEIAIDLWWAANGVYNVDDIFMFEMGEQTRLFEDAPDYYELRNYDEVMPKIFTEHGIQQAEQTCIGGSLTFIQRQNGKVYRLGPWKTGYDYGMAMTDMQVKQAQSNRVTLTVTYIRQGSIAMDGSGTPIYDTVDFTIAKENGIWLVDDYIYPESYKG